MLLVIVVFISGVCVSEAQDGKCFNHDVFEIFSDVKVKLALTARDVEDVKKDMKQMKRQMIKMTKLDLDCQYPIAFFAKNTKHKAVASGNTLTYDTTITNTCNTFDKDTGTFTCPKPGVYIFHFSAINNSKKHAYLVLFKNGSEVAWAYTDDKGSFEMGSNAALLLLKKGDKIYVKIPVNYDTTLWAKYNTFSGHIISN